MKLGATTPRATPLGIAAAVTALLAASLAAAAPEVEPRPTLARGKLLVANERLVDPNFRETVVLLLEYDADGALGVVINRPTDVKLALLLPDVEELRERSETVFLGGPVGRDRMLLLVRTGGDAPEESQRIFDDVFVTASLDVLRRVIRDPGPRDRFRAFVGFAGWAPRQLDDEIARGDARLHVVVVLFRAPQAVAVLQHGERREADRRPVRVLRVRIDVLDAEGDAVAVDHHPLGRREVHVGHAGHRRGDPLADRLAAAERAVLHLVVVRVLGEEVGPGVPVALERAELQVALERALDLGSAGRRHRRPSAVSRAWKRPS